MEQVTEKTIDIDEILKSKMGAKAKWVPGFLVSWLKRIVHQDKVNAFLWESRHKVGTEWLEACVEYLQMTLKIEGIENLPDKNDGKLYTFVSNHPLGGEDGVALGAIIGRHYDSRFRYLVNDLLMNLPGLAPLCIPINKTGHRERQPHADVSGRHLFAQAQRRDSRHSLVEDLRGEKRGISARRSAHPLQRTELEVLLSSGQFLRPLPAFQSRHAVLGRRDV